MTSVTLQRAYLPEFGTRRETRGFLRYHGGDQDFGGDNGKEMRNAGGKEEEEDVLKIQEVKLRDISETGVLLIHFQGAFKLSLKSETYHRVNNEAKVKRGQKSINQWLKHTTPGRVKPQAQSDNPSETRNPTVHEADPITIQAQAHLDPSGRLPARVTFVIQDVSGVDTFTSGGCNPFCTVLLGGAARGDKCEDEQQVQIRSLDLKVKANSVDRDMKVQMTNEEKWYLEEDQDGISWSSWSTIYTCER
ncbi:hypothetical protein EDB87DRAFT_1583083 [Lactarius vividus]|nr:hypothetical protein EDB87DRAFT_1583083 [Lactarius vividus]